MSRPQQDNRASDFFWWVALSWVELSWVALCWVELSGCWVDNDFIVDIVDWLILDYEFGLNGGEMNVFCLFWIRILEFIFGVCLCPFALALFRTLSFFFDYCMFRMCSHRSGLEPKIYRTWKESLFFGVSISFLESTNSFWFILSDNKQRKRIQTERRWTIQ